MANAGAAPTGCYKCGRPGHWSRDCPSSAPNPNPSSDSSFKTPAVPGSSSGGGGGGGAFKPAQKSSEKPKKVPKTRPKLTPELLLSDDGLGYVLRHFPRSFKYRGRGHEVSDLGNLISLYSQWHSHLLPYYSYNQFVQKVEQVCATKRVKTCIRDLREKVARGGDPTKFHEPDLEIGHDEPDLERGIPMIFARGGDPTKFHEPDLEIGHDEPDLEIGHDEPDLEREAMNSEEPSHSPFCPSSEQHDAEHIQNEMLHEIYNSIEEPSQALHSEAASAAILSVGSTEKELQNQGPDNGASSSNKVEMTDEQKARIEANRLKALEKAASRVRSLPAA